MSYLYSAAAEANRFLLELEAQVVSLRYIKECDSNACLHARNVALLLLLNGLNCSSGLTLTVPLCFSNC